jgi:bifunctional DNA-binding transcriptional regulator/antitoxin component of YhaV-PrlF toxin-antitoxin module
MKEVIGRIVNELTKPEENIEKIVTVNYDGRQFIVRIPKKISDYLEIHKGDKIKFLVNTPYVEETGKKLMVVELLD